MKAFCRWLTLFASPIILLIACLELYLKTSEGEYLLKSNHFKQATYEVLILGSSHNQNAINPAFLATEGCNAAMGSQDLKIDLALLTKAIKIDKSLKVLILEMSYHRQRANPPKYWRNSLYEYFYGIDLSGGFNISKYFLLGSNLKFFRNYLGEKLSGRKHIYKYNRFGFDENDFDGLFKSLAYDEKRIQETARYRTHLNREATPDPAAYHRAEEYLEEINAICMTNHIQLVLVAPPVFKTYSENFNDARMRSREEIIQRLRKKNPTLEWMNFEKSNLFDVMSFKNDDHLNAKGAALFTNILNDTLKIETYVR